ncbi:MAG: DUF2164 domain-containing protein [Halieaceae bacterium]
MSEIEFSREQKQEMAASVKRYFQDELKQEIGGFDAEFLVDFFAREMGGYFYNKGVQDAQTIVTAKVSEVVDALYEIEKPVE